MLASDFIKCLSRRPGATARHIIQTLANAFLSIRSGSDIQQSLISFRVLDYGRCFPVHREDNRAFSFLEKLHKVAGRPAKCS